MADFKNGSNQSIEYTYDQNGNLTKDLNKGIPINSYNSLNLPVLLSIANASGSATNSYTYSADGRKLKVEMKYGVNQTKTTDYVGSVIYENGSLKRILVDGGYIENGKYYYYIQDHLGNNRVVAQSDGTVIQTNHYYPFGLTFTENNTGDSKSQPYKYNGKEFDGERGLNVYDYSARYMDPALGRFMAVDPLAEKYYGVSPYAYCKNDPINVIDPDGKAPQDPPIYIGFHEWSREKKIRVGNIIKSTDAIGHHVFKGTGVNVSASVCSVKGNIGVGSVKGGFNIGVFNVSAETDKMNVSAKASVGEATGKISVGSASANAGITIAEAKVNNDVSLSFDAVSADAKVKLGSNTSSKLDDQGRISAGVKAGPIDVNASFSLQTAAEWVGGVINLISELLSPEIKIDTRSNYNNH